MYVLNARFHAADETTRVYRSTSIRTSARNSRPRYWWLSAAGEDYTPPPADERCEWISMCRTTWWTNNCWSSDGGTTFGTTRSRRCRGPPGTTRVSRRHSLLYLLASSEGISSVRFFDLFQFACSPMVAPGLGVRPLPPLTNALNREQAPSSR